LTPKDIFSSHLDPRGRPRAVFSIGISGSGKSFWSRGAEAAGWKVVNADQIRVDWLTEAAREGREIAIGGKMQKADPQSNEQIFSAALREKVMEVEFLSSFLEEGKTRGIVFDITNLTLRRVPLMLAAYERGFGVEALVFEPASEQAHLHNIGHRASQEGGITISAEILAELRSQYENFCLSLKEDPSFSPTLRSSELHFDFEKMRKPYASRAEFLASLSSVEKKNFEDLVANDCFTRIHRVQVRQYSK
jgi:hypothetical protein